MKKQTRLLSLPAILMAAMVSMLVTNVSINAMGTDLVWTVVTDDADSGPGTLRNAINLVNGGGTEDPNAIAFAKSVKVIQLDSLLPVITEPVLIDGLAKVSNGTVVQEGDCSTLPSPVDDPCVFSCALRVTINGSTIPLLTSPDIRFGLRVNSDDVTIRGICIINITTPEPDSVAIGIALDGSNNTIECCEIKEIRNTAGTSSASDENFAVGIVNEGNPLTVNKTYVHNIQGGLVNIDCNDTLSSSDQLVSGSAFGISTEGQITDTRVEQIQSGSIIACQPASTGEEELLLLVSTAIGITTDLEAFITPINLRTHKGLKKDCALAGVCSDCDLCPFSGSQAVLSVENSVITTIIGGSIISNIPNSIITQNYVAGIAIGSILPLSFGSFISENSISNIRTGSAALSGDNSELIRIGSRGIISLSGGSCVRCNTITDVTLETVNAGGFNTRVVTGFSHGISLDTAIGIFVECNTITNITGGRAIADGDCSKLLPSSSLIENIFLSRIKRPKKKRNSKNIPAGSVCTPALPFSVAGIYIPACNIIQVRKNKVNNVFGIQHTVRGAGAEALTIGSAGITVGNQSGEVTTVDNNDVSSIQGPGLIALAGTGKIQNLQGTVGIDANGFEIEVTNNCVKQVHEGKARVQHSSIVSHFTNASSFKLLKRFRSIDSLYKNIALIEDAESFVPVITAGIAVSGRERKNDPFGSAMPTPPFITIQDNSVSDVAGAVVPGGQLPLGSVGVGIFTQPSIEQFEDIPFGSQQTPVTLFDACNDAEAMLGIISTNTITTINGGTNAPGYGIMIDGSQLFLQLSNAGTNTDLLPLGLFNVTNNTITNLSGNGRIEPFVLTEEQLSSLQSCCLQVNGTDGTECDFTTSFIPLLPFEPTSGIYTLFGNCSALSSNTITNARDSKADARGITTAASSDMNLFDNIISQIKGFGIFVGGSIVDETLATGTEFLLEEVLPSLRNKIYNNSTFDNTNKGIELGLIDWNYFVFARNVLNACKSMPIKSDQEAPEDSFVTYGNHGQVAPCITKVTCNSNGTVTIDVTLKNTLPLTQFIIQFFRNSSNSVPHGEQHISAFNDPLLVLSTDFNGNAKARFTLLPLAKIQSGDIISAHVTVAENVLSPAGEEFFCDTSEFSSDTQPVCPLSGLMQKPNCSNKPSFANLLFRTPEGETTA